MIVFSMGVNVKMIVKRQEVLNFKPPRLLIKKFCQDHQVLESEAVERFEETKKFLYLCAKNKGINYAPSIEIDKMWHEFILNTRLYRQYCSNRFGKYVDHLPTSPIAMPTDERSTSNSLAGESFRNSDRERGCRSDCRSTCQSEGPF